jgi:ribosome-associated toxin RatA of RatAB toxin-antitoxin module
MQHRSPSGLYSKAARIFAIVVDNPSHTSLLTSKPKQSMSLSTSLALFALAWLGLAPCMATESTTGTNDSAQVSAPVASSVKLSKKHEKGLIAHVQPPAGTVDSQDAKDTKNTKDTKGPEQPKDDSHAKDGANKETVGTDEDAVTQNNIYARQYFDKIRESRKRKYAQSSSTVLIYAPEPIVWKVLTDFDQYPKMFKRIETCHITKREHGLLFAETYLKPQMFVKKLCQHTVTDISQGPHFLQWKMLDGNFSSVYGSWTLSMSHDKKGVPVCSATYTLEADPGPVIPGPMVSFLLHQIEHEVVTSFKKGCESSADSLSESKK